MKKYFALGILSFLINAGIAQIENINVKDLLTLTNQERSKTCKCASKKQKAVAPLIWNDVLATAAQVQAMFLAKKKGISHVGANGSTVASRVKKLGYQWSWVGENIAKGQESLTEVMADWMKSPGHCRNIMTGGFTEFGAAVVAAKNGQLIWVQVFATKQE
ncbi:MAG: CAP domain-containing protein [Bacteroidota bacterium]